MYVNSKVKNWIKKAGKKWLAYDPENELISDRYVVLRVTPEMKPAILEVFGHLKGGTVNTDEYEEEFPKMVQFTDMPDRCTTLKDSLLRYAFEKEENRILYNPENGQKVLIRQQFTELFQEFTDKRLATVFRQVRDGKTNQPGPIYVSDADVVFIGLIMPVISSEIDLVLDTFQFTAREAV